MILIIGGAYNGKTAFARSLRVSDDKIIFDAHEVIRHLLADGKDAEREFLRLADVAEVVTCAEIGSGIVPADEFERRWRETVGRIIRGLAERADEVYRVYYGIPQKLKGG